jgi:multidrug efflux system membrane fusion protein
LFFLGDQDMKSLPRFPLLGGCLLLAGVLAGCEAKPSQSPQAQAPVVPVSRPIEKEITDYVDFTGRTDAVESVDVRARVTGYVIKVPFKEGTEVKEGDLLFEIDPRPYQAQLDQALSQITLYKAQLQLAKSTYARDRAVNASTPGAVALQQIEADMAAVEEASARLKAYQASTEVYKLNLDFTKVTSPISGMVSRYYLTRGNLVNQDQTLLTTVVTLDPVYAYFDLDEPTLLKIRRAVNQGQVERPQDGVFKVLMGLQGEEGYPHEGTINFVNNQVNPTTGSISVRGVFPNPRLGAPVNALSLVGMGATSDPLSLIGWSITAKNRGQGSRLLSPGMFVRIRLPIGLPHRTLLVVDQAISSDQGLKYVYVVDDDNKVQYRRVRTGALQADGLRVIEDGLKPTDRVVVAGLQQVRPRATVQTEETPMPTFGPVNVETVRSAPTKTSPEREVPAPGRDKKKKN